MWSNMREQWREALFYGFLSIAGVVFLGAVVVKEFLETLLNKDLT